MEPVITQTAALCDISNVHLTFTLWFRGENFSNFPNRLSIIIVLVHYKLGRMLCFHSFGNMV